MQNTTETESARSVQGVARELLPSTEKTARIKRLVLFDCDGTLVDSQQAIVLAMTASWRAAGLADPDPQEVRRLVALPLTEMIARLLPGEDVFVVKRLAGLYRDAYYRDRHHEGHAPEPMFPGARAVLASLRAHGYGLGIVTGKSHQALVDLLEAHGLRDWFVTLQTADRCPGKPCPDMVYQAREESGVALADTLVIGDATLDIEMARAAGVRSIGVAWGYHAVHELEEAGASRIVHGFEDVPRAVLDLLGSALDVVVPVARDAGQ